MLDVSPRNPPQNEKLPGLWPKGPRHSPIAGLLLGNGDLDRLGLLSLREAHPLVVYAAEPVRAGFCAATSFTGRSSVSRIRCAGVCWPRAFPRR